MLNRWRDRIDGIIEPVARKMNVEANKVSYASLIFAFIAGILFYFSYEHHIFLVFASIATLANGFLDAIDGKIARLRKKASMKGDFIDHAIDRFSDAFIIGGIAASPWCGKFVAISAMAAVLIVSYMGTQAQAVGYKRLYSGILGRADRLAILIFSPFIQYFTGKI